MTKNGMINEIDSPEQGQAWLVKVAPAPENIFFGDAARIAGIRHKLYLNEMRSYVII